MIWLAFLVLGITYIVTAYANGGQFVGTLESAKVITTTSCSKNSCSNTYYVGETFRKDNTTNTCLVQRLKPYYFMGDADNVATHEELGTTRTIWTTYYDAGTCYDAAIRSVYAAVGWTFMALAIFIVGVVLLVIFYESMVECWRYMRSRIIMPDLAVVVPTAAPPRMANVTIQPPTVYKTYDECYQAGYNKSYVMAEKV